MIDTYFLSKHLYKSLRSSSSLGLQLSRAHYSFILCDSSDEKIGLHLTLERDEI